MRHSTWLSLLSIVALTTACGSTDGDATGSQGSAYSDDPSNPQGAPKAPEDPKLDPTTNTIVRVHYPEGKGDMNMIGDAGPLSSAPASMKKIAKNTWEVDLGVISTVSHVHPFLGTKPARGPDYLVQPGQTLDIYPHFCLQKGSVVTLWPLFVSKIHTKVMGGVRQIQVYFPPTYLENTEARFPVVYVMDAQIYFGTSPNWTLSNALATGAFGDMLADETVDAASESGKFAEAIIVGVDTPINVPIPLANATHDRMLELTTTPQSEDPGTGKPYPGDFGEGPHFLEMVTKELKPLVDQQLRTLPDKNHTYISGASLGGLMTMYAGAAHEDVFGGIMSFSGSAWWDHKSVIQKIKDTSGGPFRIYADVGGAEDTSMIDDNKLAFQAYVDKGYVEGKTLMTQIYPGGVHHGTSWAKRVPDAFTFALGPGR